MNIVINKDILTEYRDEVIRGFTLKEAGCILAGVTVMMGVAVLSWKLLGISPSIGCYIGLPFTIGLLFFGFKKFQGLDFVQYIREIIWEKRTRILVYDADEAKELSPMFSLKKEKRSGIK